MRRSKWKRWKRGINRWRKGRSLFVQVEHRKRLQEEEVEEKRVEEM